MSWAQIVSAVNSNLSQPLDKLINSRINQQDTRLSALESQIASIVNKVTNNEGLNDKILERVSTWRTIASNTVRDRRTPNSDINFYQVAATEWMQGPAFQVYLAGLSRIKIVYSLLSSHNITHDIKHHIRFAGIPGTSRTLTSRLNTTNTQVYDIPYREANSIIRMEATNEPHNMPYRINIQEFTMMYDFVEIIPKRGPDFFR